MFHCPTVGKEPNASLSEAEVIFCVNYWLPLVLFCCLLDFSKYCPTIGLTDPRWDPRPAHLCSCGPKKMGTKGWKLAPSMADIFQYGCYCFKSWWGILSKHELSLFCYRKELVVWLFPSSRNYCFWTVLGSNKKIIQLCIYLVIWTFFHKNLN